MRKSVATLHNPKPQNCSPRAASWRPPHTAQPIRKATYQRPLHLRLCGVQFESLDARNGSLAKLREQPLAGSSSLGRTTAKRRLRMDNDCAAMRSAQSIGVSLAMPSASHLLPWRPKFT
jgi:hypothetical protein